MYDVTKKKLFYKSTESIHARIFEKRSKLSWKALLLSNAGSLINPDPYIMRSISFSILFQSLLEMYSRLLSKYLRAS